jgi:hypothetical protein
VPRELLGRREISPRIEQISDERAPHVVGREAPGLYLPAQSPEDVVDRLVAHPPPLDLAVRSTEDAPEDQPHTSDPADPGEA